jgi:hypothetical protein
MGTTTLNQRVSSILGTGSDRQRITTTELFK